MDQDTVKFIIFAITGLAVIALAMEVLNAYWEHQEEKWQQGYPERSAQRYAIWASEGGFPRLLTSEQLDKIDGGTIVK